MTDTPETDTPESGTPESGTDSPSPDRLAELEERLEHLEGMLLAEEALTVQTAKVDVLAAQLVTARGVYLSGPDGTPAARIQVGDDRCPEIALYETDDGGADRLRFRAAVQPDGSVVVAIGDRQNRIRSMMYCSADGDEVAIGELDGSLEMEPTVPRPPDDEPN